MAYTFRRAYKAILATSSTTAFAFLSNGFSSLMPVSAFGYFAFVIVPVNYVLIVFYFPAFLIIYEKSVRDKEKMCYICFRYVFCCDSSKKVGKVQVNKELELQQLRELVSSNSLNLRHEKIQTRFDDESFLTNQFFLSHRGSKGSVAQQEYYSYMQ
jgi:predicted RND superfamily exporter protein